MTYIYIYDYDMIYDMILCYYFGGVKMHCQCGNTELNYHGALQPV